MWLSRLFVFRQLSFIFPLPIILPIIQKTSTGTHGTFALSMINYRLMFSFSAMQYGHAEFFLCSAVAINPVAGSAGLSSGH